MCNLFTVDLQVAVAQRFTTIRPKLQEREGDYCYFGCRTAPEQLGGRFAQMVLGGCHVAIPGSLPGEVLAGKFDKEIEAAWSDAAAAEYHYRYEKAW